MVPYQCLYLRYRSHENWQEQQDILRCNPEFHGHPRYDRVLINTNPLSFGRIHALFSCFGTGNIRHDIALIRALRPSSWKPRTKWEGCQIFEKEFDFFLIKYLIHGFHFIPIIDGLSRRYCLNDLVNGDAFIRFFLEERLSQSQL